ncbi:hypothetical protein CPB86DRAFT_787602 [Serendipita vermifera]|nr:hypothetical protein CPB86DRAFT_787602 [Serendipita vermifera]
MSSYAGVALGQVAVDAPVCVTLVSGSLDDPVFTKSTTYQLQGANLSEDVPSTLSKIVDEVAKDCPLELAIPLAFTHQQISTLNHLPPIYRGYDTRYIIPHHKAIIRLYDDRGITNDSPQLNILYLDVTPGQLAATLVSTENSTYYQNRLFMQRLTVLESDADEQITMMIDDIMSQLVTPTVPPSARLDKIYIFHASGKQSTELTYILHSTFPNSQLRWVTLSDVSRGAAISAQRSPKHKMFFGCMYEVAATPVSVATADGRQVIVVRRNTTIPFQKEVFFTTCKDDQTTVTLQVFSGRVLREKVVLAGLVPRPKGIPRIRVSIDVPAEREHIGDVVVEEVGSGLRKKIKIPYIFGRSRKEIEEYFVNPLEEEGNSVVTADEVAGELPERGDSALVCG